MAGNVEFELISADESWAIFEENAHRLLGISAEEFIEHWDAGEYEPVTDTRVMQLLMLRPSGG